jgi:hypothetical protein
MKMMPRSQTTRYQKYSLRLLRLYPQAWRERYASEVMAVLEERPATPGTLLDLFLGMLDARMHTRLFTERTFLLQQRVRDSQVAVFCSFILAALVWLGYNFLYNNIVMLFLIEGRYSLIEGRYSGVPDTSSAQAIINFCGFSALLITAIGALILVIRATIQAFAQKRGGLLALLFAWLTSIAFTIMQICVFLTLRMVFPPLLLLSLIWTFIVGPFCMIIGTRKTEFSPFLTRIVSIATGLVALAMSIMLVAMTYQAIALHMSAFDFTLKRVEFFDLSILAMALLTALSYVALWRGFKAQRELRLA